MKKCLLAIFLILGTVIGSGFSSGKEVFVFFSRFGYYSFVFIPIAFLLFYFVFYFLMIKGRARVENLIHSRFLSVLMLICAIVFSSSMFAGIKSCMLGNSLFITILLFVLIFILCFYACYKKLDYLSALNLFLIPILLVILLLFFMFKITDLQFTEVFTPNFELGVFGGGFYSILYILLNVSLSSIVIAKSGEGMTKKQIRRASFVSAFILSAFLLMVNILLICNYDLASCDMPLLALSDGAFTYLLTFVIMIGCLTTLLSDIYIASSSCKQFHLKGRFNFVICVILPYVISNIGFSYIVSWLYPIVSLLGIVIMFLIFFKKPT